MRISDWNSDVCASDFIICRRHETTEVPALIAFQALAFDSVARMLDHPISGSVTLGFALAAAFLTRGWIGFLPIMLAVLFIFTPGSVLWRQKKWLLISAILSTALILLWWIPAKIGRAHV